MMNVRSLLWLTLSMIPMSAGASTPTGLFHDLPTSIRMGEDVPVSVTLEGASDEEPLVSLYYRNKGAREYHSEILRAVGNGRFEGTLSASSTKSLELKYYIEASDPNGAYCMRLGSPDHPLGLLLCEPASIAGPGLGLKVGITALSVLLTLSLAWYGKRYEKKRVLRKQAKGQDPYQAMFAEESDRHAGPDRNAPFSSLVSSHTGAVRSQLDPLAFRISLLCAAAWFHTVCRKHAEGMNLDLTKQFEAARETVERIQKVLRDHRTDRAAPLLIVLAKQRKHIQKVIGNLDATCTSDELEHCLVETHFVTVGLLGKLLEYYALVCQRTSDTRKKLLVLASILVSRNTPNGHDPDQVRRALCRLSLLRNTYNVIFPEKLVQRAGRLRNRILTLQAINGCATGSTLYQQGLPFLIVCARCKKIPLHRH